MENKTHLFYKLLALLVVGSVAKALFSTQPPEPLTDRAVTFMNELPNKESHASTDH